MAATYTEVTLQDMETFLKRAYRALRPKKGDSIGETYYDLNLSDGNILVRVWTSIPSRGSSGAQKGMDAIRVTMVTGKGKPLMPKGKIVKRTQNWRNALQDRIEELVEVYESKAGYWKERRTQRDEDEAPRESIRREVEDREEEDAPPPSSRPTPPASNAMHEGTFVSSPKGGWAAKITGRASPGDKAILTTKGGKRVPVTLVVRTWAGTDRYNNGAYAEIWTIEESRRQASELDGVGRDLGARIADRVLSAVESNGADEGLSDPDDTNDQESWPDF